jgi:hypothetical protein
MPVLTLLTCAAAVGCTTLLTPTEPPCLPQADAPYTVMDDYVRSLEFWHRNPDWGFSAPAPRGS